MPSKTKLKNAAIAARTAALPKIPTGMIDQFVIGPMTGEAVNAASMAFKNTLIKRAVGAQLEPAANQRNCWTGKTVLAGAGQVCIEVPRDRDGSFEPILIPKHERRFTGLDHNISAMNARDMTMREIQGFLLESCGTDVSAEFISSMTETVMAEVTAWYARALEPMYPVVFFDALRVKIKEDAVVRDKTVYLALGVLSDGSRDILGL